MYDGYRLYVEYYTCSVKDTLSIVGIHSVRRPYFVIVYKAYTAYIMDVLS